MLVQGCHQWWPHMDWSADQVFVAWITTAASPSKIPSWRPISIANWTARLHARASTSATDWGRGICTESAPMTAPLLSQITTPSQLSCCSWKLHRQSWLCTETTLVDTSEDRVEPGQQLGHHLVNLRDPAAYQQLWRGFGSRAKSNAQGEWHSFNLPWAWKLILVYKILSPSWILHANV